MHLTLLCYAISRKTSCGRWDIAFIDLTKMHQHELEEKNNMNRMCATHKNSFIQVKSDKFT